MRKLIDQQAAIDAIEETNWYHQNKNKDMVHGANSQEHQAWYKAEDIYQALDRLPSVQPERKKGRWEKQRETYCSWSCSACKEIVVAMPERMGYPLYDYCPNCGADMREEGAG